MNLKQNVGNNAGRMLAMVAAFFVLALPQSPVHAQFVEDNPYMGTPTELAKASNGAIGNKCIIDNAEKVAYLEPTIENPAPGIYVFGGFGLAPTAVIEGEDALIAFDTGDLLPYGGVVR